MKCEKERSVYILFRRDGRVWSTAPDRTHTIYVVFHSCGFYDVSRLLIADVR